MSNDKEREALVRFTKKPVTIEAIQWDGTESGIQRIKAVFLELETCAKSGHLRRDEVTHWRIRTLEGSHIVSPGDWIIKGVKGEFYPCKPDIFELTYQPAAALSEQAAAVSEGLFVQPISGDKLWLWQDGHKLLAYRHEYPCYSPGGDPCVLGEPVAEAEYRESYDRSCTP